MQGPVVVLEALVVTEPLVVLVVVAICWTTVLNLFPFGAFFGFGHSVRETLVVFGSVQRFRHRWHRWCH